MPEGDTIWRTAAALRERLSERRVTGARPAALGRLTGRRLRAVEPVGKHLYMHFEGGLVLHTHMRMTGAWHLYHRGDRWHRAAHRATAVLDFDDEQAVLFAAPTCELLAASAADPGLGPDILAADFDLVEVVRRARGCARPTVAEVLLDQSVCAGIGNIYRCDALWYQRLNPLMPVAELADDDLSALYRRARDLLRRNVVGDAFATAGAVHGRAGKTCRRCPATVTSVPLGSPSRILYWCPACQPAGPVAASGGPVR